MCSTRRNLSGGPRVIFCQRQGRNLSFRPTLHTCQWLTSQGRDREPREVRWRYHASFYSNAKRTIASHRLKPSKAMRTALRKGMSGAAACVSTYLSRLAARKINIDAEGRFPVGVQNCWHGKQSPILGRKSPHDHTSAGDTRKG
jgi:hypothetical protein